MRTIAALAPVAVILVLAGLVQAQPCSPVCRQGYACQQGQCVAECNPPCPTGTACVDGTRCEPVPLPCNPPCPAGEACVDGARCQPVAACSPPCREGFQCVDGQCVEAPPPTTTGPATEPAADETPVPLGTQVKLLLGFGGEASSEGEEFSSHDDLIPTIGVGAESDWAGVRGTIGFGVGLLLNALFWNTSTASDADIGRSFLLDIDVVLKPNYQVQPHAFLYLGLLGGLTMSIPNPDSFAGDVALGFGFNFGFVVGGQYDLEAVGFVAEMGYQTHSFSNTVGTALRGDVDVDTSFGQFVLNLGLAF